MIAELISKYEPNIEDTRAGLEQYFSKFENH